MDDDDNDEEKKKVGEDSPSPAFLPLDSPLSRPPVYLVVPGRLGGSECVSAGCVFES